MMQLLDAAVAAGFTAEEAVAAVSEVGNVWYLTTRRQAELATRLKRPGR